MPGTRPLRPTDPAEIAGFRLTARIGEGAQGAVFLGESPGGGRVAVKVLHADFGSDPRARTGFERELAAARRVAPFCTAPILVADAAADPPYIVSEYIEGPSLRDLVAERGVVSGAALTSLAIGTATALAAIHEAGVVHRDFKPANVLLGADGPRVIDFGIARSLDATSATMTGAVGTPAFMAPEQVEGTSGGPPLDMFAWGCTMAFAANGRPPFGNDTVPAIMRRVLQEQPELGALAGDVRELVEACLAKDPADRPAASEVLRRLLGTGPGADLLAEGSSAATLTSAAASPSTTTPYDSPWTSPSAPPPAPPFAPPAFPPPVPPPLTHPYPTVASPPPSNGRPLLVAGAAAAVAVLAAAGIVVTVLTRDDDRARNTPASGRPLAGATPTSTFPGGTAEGCAYEPATGPSKDVGRPPRSGSIPGGATIATSLGALEVRLDAAKAPCAVNSLAFLAGKGFYDGSPCHRITTDPTLKVLQCGDPTGTGQGGPGYEFDNENTDGVRYTRGTVAMANAGPDTNGSQFFILYDDAPALPRDYPVIGHVTSGMEVVDRVAAAGAVGGATDGAPEQDITVTVLRTH